MTNLEGLLPENKKKFKIKNPDTYFCSKCRRYYHLCKLIEDLKLMKNGSYGIKGSCFSCGKFIKWIPKKESAVYGKLYQIEKG